LAQPPRRAVSPRTGPADLRRRHFSEVKDCSFQGTTTAAARCRADDAATSSHQRTRYRGITRHPVGVDDVRRWTCSRLSVACIAECRAESVARLVAQSSRRERMLHSAMPAAIRMLATIQRLNTSEISARSRCNARRWISYERCKPAHRNQDSKPRMRKACCRVGSRSENQTIGADVAAIKKLAERVALRLPSIVSTVHA